MNDQLRQAPIGIIEATHEGQITATNEAVRVILSQDGESGNLEGQSIVDVFPESAPQSLQESFKGGFSSERSFEEYYPEIERWLHVKLRSNQEHVTVYVQDVSNQYDTEQTVERLQHRLGRLEQIDTLVSTVLDDLIEASHREEIAQTISQRLDGMDLYDFTWVGGLDRASEEIEVIAASGDAPEMRETIEQFLNDENTLIEERALETGSTQLVDAIPNEESLPRELRVVTFGQGLQSILAIPLVYRDTVYGVLGVYTGRSEGFSTHEQNSLETLGAVAGFAINAIRRENLLFANTVTELQLEIQDPSIPLVDLIGQTGSQLSLSGAVPRGQDTTVYYLREKYDDRSIAEISSEHDDVVDTRVIRKEDEDSVFEMEIAADTPVSLMMSWGATIQTARYEDGAAQVHTELPPESDVRRLVEQLDDEFANVEITTKQEKPHEPETVQTFRSEFGENLTEKEYEVLRIAYLSEYFASPRGSTSEEVAEALDITAPTVLYHLRKAERKLLETFFETMDTRDHP